MIEQDAQAMVDYAWEPENAVKILEKLLFRPAHRANGKFLMTASIDMALCRAIVALKKESKENSKDVEKTRNIADRTVYTDYKHEAWVAALNILATEFYVKTNEAGMF